MTWRARAVWLSVRGARVGVRISVGLAAGYVAGAVYTVINHHSTARS